MSQIWEYTKIAIKNIKSNKGRSVLTMLGIIIGISSVIMVMSVGNGVKKQMGEELNNIGGGQITIYTESGTPRFTIDDFELIREKVAGIKAVSPYIGDTGNATGSKGEFKASIRGGNEGMLYNVGDPIVAGRYFNAEEVAAGEKVCVITESSAKKLFGTTNVLGLDFELNIDGISQDLSIIGLRKDSAAGLITAGSQDQLTIELPYTVLGNDFQYYIENFGMFYIVAESNTNSSQVAQKTINLLESRYSIKGENLIKVENFTDIAAQIDSVMGTITIFISFVAAISLLVGGIGVMNIMLVSVTERTREIGIRKALGARTGSILMQFLAEAGMITLLGGIIGIILGIMGGSLIGNAAKITPSISVVTIFIAVIFSSGVGLFFGIYPAKKAAALSPIEALRHE